MNNSKHLKNLEHAGQDNGVLFDEPNPTKKMKKRSGPPNRMNDLPYREWMKFQKSFFWVDTFQSLVEESIYFFTKSIWPNGEPSRSLIIGHKKFDKKSIPSPRFVETKRISSIEKLNDSLKPKINQNQKYDFILIDLRKPIADTQNLSLFLTSFSDRLYQILRQLLNDEKYCVLLSKMNGKEGGGFPIPWSVALSCRKHLRLRDEKIGLVKGGGITLYYLVMQAKDDNRPVTTLMPSDLHLAKSSYVIPSWIIPKPPPRKKHEILHPAKYPETLISEFIEIFTSPGDKVFDPMVGTGSTVLAAIRADRNGYGIDLSEEYVRIAQRRILEEYSPTKEEFDSNKQTKIFPDIDLNKPLQLSLFNAGKSKRKAQIYSGDSVRLSKISELKKLKFEYVCTSPPYWSMLANPGSEGQRSRREKKLPLVYSEDSTDIGNVTNYDEFLDLLLGVYEQVANKLTDTGYLTVVLKNVKRDHIVYPLAWDLVINLSGDTGKFDYIGNTLWCQDDVGLKPFAVGIVWVSNTLHHYCLHFRKRAKK
jgi:DNA modification methylase